jgi:hypothetical protein
MQLEESRTYEKKSGARRPTGFGHWPGGPGGPSGGSGRGPYGGSGGGAPRGLDNVQGIDHCKFMFSIPSSVLLNHEPFLDNARGNYPVFISFFVCCLCCLHLGPH